MMLFIFQFFFHYISRQISLDCRFETESLSDLYLFVILLHYADFVALKFAIKIALVHKAWIIYAIVKVPGYNNDSNSCKMQNSW